MGRIDQSETKQRCVNRRGDVQGRLRLEVEVEVKLYRCPDVGSLV